MPYNSAVFTQSLGYQKRKCSGYMGGTDGRHKAIHIVSLYQRCVCKIHFAGLRINSTYEHSLNMGVPLGTYCIYLTLHQKVTEKISCLLC